MARRLNAGSLVHMSTSYSPALKERSTEELLKIVETPEDWREDALSIAKEELQKRGFTIPQQKRREKSRQQFEKRTKKVKSEATFSLKEKIAILALAPFILAVRFEFIPIPTGLSTWELKSDGFQRKWKQRLLLMTLGNTLWVFILILFL